MICSPCVGKGLCLIFPLCVAVIQMAKSLAVEWAEHGIRVNSLSPGYMRTPLVADVLRNAEDNLEVKPHILSSLNITNLK